MGLLLKCLFSNKNKNKNTVLSLDGLRLWKPMRGSSVKARPEDP